MRALTTPPLFDRLSDARKVVIAGAGGGFDVYAGLPLAVSLWDAGVEAHLANLSFSQLELLDLDVWLAENIAAVTPEVTGLADCFPERTLARWLATRTTGSTLFVNPLMAIYFSFELDALAGRSLYLDRLENTYGMRQVASRIEQFRDETDPRVPSAFPH